MPREKNPATSSPRKSRKAVLPAPVETPSEPPVASFVDPEHRASLIAEAAYFRSERRGFAAGYELEDWLAAEAEVDARLLQGTRQEAQPPS